MKNTDTAEEKGYDGGMKHFSQKLNELHLMHYHTYPNTPKMNAHCERFNRTIQEEFVDFHANSLIDPSSFNQKLIPWLVWYNTERPHWGLGLKSPMQFILNTHPEKSNMWWTDTDSCNKRESMLASLKEVVLHKPGRPMQDSSSRGLHEEITMDSSEKIAMAVTGKVSLETPEELVEFIFEFLKQQRSSFKEFTGFQELQTVVGKSRGQYDERAIKDTCLVYMPNAVDLAHWKHDEGITDAVSPFTSQTHCSEVLLLDRTIQSLVESPHQWWTERSLVITRQIHLLMVSIQYIRYPGSRHGSSYTREVVQEYMVACVGKPQLHALLQRDPADHWNAPRRNLLQGLYDIALRNVYRRERLFNKAQEIAASFKTTFERVGAPHDLRRKDISQLDIFD